MNKYLEKIAEFLSTQTKDDLKNTAGIMGLGTVMAGVGGLANRKLGLEEGATKGLLSKLSPKAKLLTAAGTLGALGGIGDFAALKAHRALSKGPD